MAGRAGRGVADAKGALHALVLLAIVLGLAPLAEHIPHAVLAGILFKVGIEIIDWDYLRRIRRVPRVGVFFMLVVLGLTVFVDLIVAVAVGVVMASLLFVKRMAGRSSWPGHARRRKTFWTGWAYSTTCPPATTSKPAPKPCVPPWII